MDRPAGVTVLSILNFLGAGLCVVGGVLFLVGMGLAGLGAHQSGAGAGAMGMLMGMGAVAGVVFLVFAAIAIVIGIGLWKLRNWARIVTIILDILSILLMIPGLLGTVMNFAVVPLVFQLLILAFYAWVLWYMFRAHVKQAFGVT